MPFVRNAEVVEALGNTYGEYDSTFTSESGQVRADLFRQRDALVAYISFPEGRQIQDVTDKYIAALKQHAAQVGYAEKLRILYSEN